MSIAVRSVAQDGSGGVWLDEFGQVSSWQHTITFPGGDSAASFSFACDPTFVHPGLLPGRILQAVAGSALVWVGRLEEPDRSQNPWSVSAVGRAYLAKDHVVTTSGSTLNTVVDAAISNGLPWTRPASLTNPDSDIARFGTVDDALGLLAQDQEYWSLDVNGVVTTPSYPSGPPTLAVYVTDLAPRTLENYANVVIVEYIPTGSSTPTVTTVTAAAAELAARGRVETFLDITASGQMTLAQAQAAGAALIQQDSVPTWSAGFTAAPGTLFTLAGGPVDPATARPGAVMRVFTLHSDDLGTTSMDIPVGQVVYDDGDGTNGTAQLTPLAAAENSLLAMLAKAARADQAA